MADREKTCEVLDDVLEERMLQNRKWGEQNHPDRRGLWYTRAAELEQAARESLEAGPSWAAILAEEVGEALQEDDPAKLRAELLQVAAVAVAWVEAIDRREVLRG